MNFYSKRRRTSQKLIRGGLNKNSPKRTSKKVKKLICRTTGTKSLNLQDEVMRLNEKKISGGFSLAPCYLWTVFLFFSSGVALAAEGSLVMGLAERIGDASHFEFSGLSDWNYEVKKTGSEVEITLPAFDEKTELNLRNYSDSLVKDIEVDKNASDGRYKLLITLADAEVESFDYLTNEPSRLIVDFYRVVETNSEISDSEGDSTPKQEVSASVNKVQTTSAPTNKMGYKKVDRNRSPAGGELLRVDQSGDRKAKESPEVPQKGAFDGGDPDYERFQIRDYEIDEDSIIASKKNIYLHFPMLKMSSSELESIFSNPPEYVIRPLDTKENKEARLLQTLYAKGRQAAFIKTFEYFIKEYPDSVYDELVRHMAADIFYKMWKEKDDDQYYTLAKDQYLRLLQKYKDSPLTERIKLIVAYSELERGASLLAIQRLLAFINEHPESDHIDSVRKSLAEAYLQINKFDQALEVYDGLSNIAQKEISKIEGSFRKGDVYFSRKDYDSAVNHYLEAIKKHSKFVSEFPNALFNLGESYFWLGKYRNSLSSLIEFVRNFPDHNYGGFALTRIGEILEVLGADEKKVMGAFLESHFRYRGSPGADVARIRMLSQRMTGMKEKELKRAQEEMLKIRDKSKLDQISDFVTLMISDGLHRRGEYDKSLEYLVEFYQQNPTSTDLESYRERIERNISKGLQKRVDDNDYMAALEFHSKYQNTWLRYSDRMDVPYLLASAYEQAGVYSESEKFLKEILKRRLAIKGTQEERERRVNEYLPSIDQIQLRLASVVLAEREFAEANDHLKKIESEDNLSEQERIEKAEIEAIVAEQRGRVQVAQDRLKKLVNEWQGQDEFLAPAHLKRAQLAMRSGKPSRAVVFISELEDLWNKKGKESISEKVMADGLQLKAEALLQEGKSLSAVSTYERLIGEFSHVRPMGSIRYKAGRILFDRGDFRGAKALWDKLDPEVDKMYRSLAEEKMEHAQWENDYKKYIDRIPAMTKMEEDI